MKNNSSLYLCIFLSSLVFLFAFPITMASEEKPYMVYMHQKPEGVNCETYQLSALSKVLGSEEAAKKSIVYHYSDVVSGFAAKLTPEQAEELKKLPEVTSVSISKPYTLFDPSHKF